MKKSQFALLVSMFIVSADALLYSQDRYPVKQLTSDSAREGFPSWSPDGTTIVYSFYSIIKGKPVFGLRKIFLDGGAPLQFTEFICEHPQWSPDGRFIVFDADSGAGMRMIEAKGGSPTKFIPDSIRIHNGGLPLWSPSGSHIAFIERDGPSLCVYDVTAGGVAKIFREEGMVPLPGCWSRDGESILIALMERQTRKSTIWRISRDGEDKQQITGHHDAFYRYLALSPDGSLLVYAAMEGKRLGLRVMPANGGKSIPLTATPLSHNECPAWSPDGKRIAFASGRTGHGDIYLMELDVEKIKKELHTLNQ